MNAKTEIAHWAKTDEPAEGPKNALSHSPVERSEHRILGGPGTQRELGDHGGSRFFSD
jgi:hypothetical protein